MSAASWALDATHVIRIISVRGISETLTALLILPRTAYRILGSPRSWYRAADAGSYSMKSALLARFMSRATFSRSVSLVMISTSVSRWLSARPEMDAPTEYSLAGVEFGTGTR